MNNPYQPPRVPPSVVDADPTAVQPAADRSSRAIVAGAMAAGLGGGVLGIVSRLLRPHGNVGGVHYEALAALGILLVTTVGLLYSHRTAPRAWGQCAFQSKNLALWSGFSAGWTLIHRSVWRDFVAAVSAWGIGCAIVGGLALIWLQSRR